MRNLEQYRTWAWSKWKTNDCSVETSSFHAMLGLVGELHEFEHALKTGDREEIRGEAGDLMYYNAILAGHYDKASEIWRDETWWDAIPLTALHHTYDVLVREVSIQAEKLKKFLFKADHEHMEYNSQAIFDLISMASSYSLYDLSVFNVDKLNARYPSTKN